MIVVARSLSDSILGEKDEQYPSRHSCILGEGSDVEIWWSLAEEPLL